MSATKHFLRLSAAAMLMASSPAVLAASGASVTPVSAVNVPTVRIEVRPPRVDEGQIDKVQPGMSRDDVTAIVGTPDKMAAFPRSRTIAWDYNYTDAWGYVAVFSVIFDDTSMVVSKVNARRLY